MDPEPEKGIKEMMAEVSKKSFNDFEFEYQLNRNVTGHKIRIFTEIEEIFEDKEMEPCQLVIYSLAVENFRLGQNIGDAIMNGYYDAAFSLLRPLNENLIYMEYFPQYKETAKPWLEEENGVFSDYPSPKEVASTDNTLRSFISKNFLHTTPQSAQRVIKGGGDDLSFRYYPEYEEHTCETTLEALILFQWSSVIHLQHAFKEDLWERNDWKEEFREVHSAVELYVEKLKGELDKELEFSEKIPSMHD